MTLLQRAAASLRTPGVKQCFGCKARDWEGNKVNDVDSDDAVQFCALGWLQKEFTPGEYAIIYKAVGWHTLCKWNDIDRLSFAQIAERLETHEA